MITNLQKELIKGIKRMSSECDDKTKFHHFVGASLLMCAQEMSHQGWLIGFGGYMGAFESTTKNDAFGAAWSTYIELIGESEPFEDVLLNAFTELATDGDAQAKCQHFTPPALSKGAMRMMMMKEVSHTMNDPTCGSGALLLAACQAAEPDGLLLRHVTGNDLDPMCAGMTALQLMSNQSIHERPIGSVTIQCRDIISEYLMFKPIVTCTRQEYFLAMQHEYRQINR